eukprot:Awhi_evm2s1540
MYIRGNLQSSATVPEKVKRSHIKKNKATSSPMTEKQDFSLMFLLLTRLPLLTLVVFSFLFSQGTLDVTVQSSIEGREPIHVDELKTGDFAGLGSFFENTCHSATVTAKSECQILQLSQDDFHGLLSSNPAISSALFAYFSSSVKKQRSGLAHFNEGSDEDDSKIKIAFFDSKSYDMESFKPKNEEGDNYEITFFEAKLGPATYNLASGHQVVCVFVNDTVDKETIKGLHHVGVKMIALRCAGFNNVDLGVAEGFGITVARVPVYSPFAVAEFAMCLLQTINRKPHQAYNRVRNADFSLSGLVGIDLHGKTVGVIGTGKIGQCFMDIAMGYGCKIAAYDVYPNKEYGAKEQVTYMELDELYAKADVISIHCPLFPSTHHMINKESLAKMKKGVILVNSSRGGLINTEDLIAALKSGHVRGAGLDVYEGESEYFFQNLQGSVVQDDTLTHLISLPNVVLSSHQAFLTEEALNAIAETTLKNVKQYSEGKRLAELDNHVPAS